MEAGLSLGSNLGDRLEQLRRAVSRLAALPGVRILARSRVYETEPVEVPAAYRGLVFLNAVVIAEWPGTPRELLAAAKELERLAGRERGERNGPRTLDLDILYAGGTRLDEPDLVVPHPRWAERRFVVEPLADVRPDLVLPGGRLTAREALAALPAGGVRVFAESL
jgi:2-amino-4-hydroxy-6-hydroxymethyldihydropteridine diphosphokinase